MTTENNLEANELDKVIGIVGGMGPQSGVMLCNYIVSFTKALIDQQHLSVISMSFPQYIPDRTLFLEGFIKTNPAYQIAQIIGKLEQAGANLIGIACNTCHSKAIFDVILEELMKIGSRVKLLNMPIETCNSLTADYPQVKRVGVMATNGVFKSRVYENILKDAGYDIFMPDFAFQNSVIHRMIYDPRIGLKANPDKVTTEANVLFNQAINYFKKEGVQAIVLGCTEFSLFSEGQEEHDIIFIDSTKSLAKALVRQARDSHFSTVNEVLKS